MQSAYTHLDVHTNVNSVVESYRVLYCLQLKLVFSASRENIDDAYVMLQPWDLDDGWSLSGLELYHAVTATSLTLSPLDFQQFPVSGLDNNIFKAVYVMKNLL